MSRSASWNEPVAKIDGVVVLAQVVKREVGAEVDVGEQADVAALQDIRERHDDLLDARVVGGHAVAHEAERRGQSLEEVDARRRAPVLEGCRRRRCRRVRRQ